jgi:RNA polymerase sigma-70 factor (ECF subfamily)
MMDNSEKEIEELVIKSQQGDAEAFAQIYDVFVTPIYRYIFYKVKKEDVEDLVETLFLKAWENIGKYKKQKKTSFKSWIFRIAHNLVVDHYRLTREHASLDPRISDTKRESDPVQQAKLKLDNERLKAAIDKLKPNYQQIVLLKFINELSNEEIAKVLKKSEGSVRILQFRALKALKVVLQDMGVKEYE